MKSNVILLVMLFFFGTSTAFSQTAAKEEVKLKCNVTCGGCKASIEGKMKDQSGVESVDASIENKVVTIAYDPQKTTPEELSASLKSAGYANKIVTDKNHGHADCSPECKKECCAKKDKKDCSAECKKECCAKKDKKDCSVDCKKECCKKG